MAQISTPYYVDYRINLDHYGRLESTYYALTRTKDDAILYSNGDLDNIFAECFKRGIHNDQIVLL